MSEDGNMSEEEICPGEGAYLERVYGACGVGEPV